MKNIITILLLMSTIISFSQEFLSEAEKFWKMKEAVDFQNIHRRYFEYKPLILDDELIKEAQQWADKLAELNKPDHSTEKDGKGELIFFSPKNYFKDFSNPMINASVFWILSEDDNDKLTTEQILCKKCSKVGFGISSSNDTYFIVAKYDKMGDFK